MSGIQHSSQSAPPCVEALESRRLLSAAPISYLPGPPARHAAAIVHSTIPVLTGAPFVGTATASDGTTDGLAITVTSERKSGALAGSFTVSLSGQSLTYAFTGSVNRRGALVLHGRSGGHKTVTVTGTASADGKTLSGKFSASSRHNSSHGTFTASRS